MVHCFLFLRLLLGSYYDLINGYVHFLCCFSRYFICVLIVVRICCVIKLYAYLGVLVPVILCVCVSIVVQICHLAKRCRFLGILDAHVCTSVPGKKASADIL